MNVRKLSLLVFVVLSVLMQSCLLLGPSRRGNGHVTEERRKVKPFEELEVSRGMNVYITQGDTASLIVRADENLHDLIVTEGHGNKLEIYLDGNVRRAEKLEVYLTVPNLETIDVSSGANVYSKGLLVFGSLDVSNSSGSNSTLEIKSNEFHGKTSSGANMYLKGEAQHADLRASSGSNIKAENLQSVHCEADVSSGANIFVGVKDALDAEASSGGNVFYFGDPAQKNTSASSGGNIIKR